MYTEKQLERMLGKLKRLEEMLEPKLFYTVGTVPMKAFLTDGSHIEISPRAKMGLSLRGREFTAGSWAAIRFRRSWTGSGCLFTPRFRAMRGCYG